MTDTDHFNRQDALQDIVNQAVIAGPDAISMLGSGQLYSGRGNRIIRERFDR